MRAWQRFSRARGARLGLALFGLLLAIALGANLIASDLPLLARVHGRLYLLPCVMRPAALADEDNQSLAAHLAPGDFVIAPLVPYGPYAQHPGGVTEVLSVPSPSHLLGTDDRGRDVLSRLIHGTRIALTIGPLAVGIALALGLLVGLLCALGRTGDFVLGRAIEIGLTFPTLFLLLAIQGLSATASLLEVGLAIALTQWPTVARLTRADALAQMASPHVEAARAIGASPTRIALVHVLPLASTSALVSAAFGVGQAVLFETALTFLGFGVPPPLASWGELLSQAQSSGLDAWLLWPPTIAIALTVIACNLVGDGVRKMLEEPG